MSISDRIYAVEQGLKEVEAALWRLEKKRDDLRHELYLLQLEARRHPPSAVDIANAQFNLKTAAEAVNEIIDI